MELKIKNIGQTSYSEALIIQHEAHKAVLNGGVDTLILCEHPHVYTLGKSADKNNLLITKTVLQQIGAEVHDTERGGDITYHGPGQLVGYPIINLRKHGIGVKKYVEILEYSIIQALATFSIDAYQLAGLTGIWVGGEREPKKQKIGAIGIRVRGGVSMHGFALNVNTDLKYFDHIVPCGIADMGVTSIYQETGKGTVADFSKAFVQNFENEWQKKLNL